ncbi:MAG TPA: Rieske 2Fe-2S domain-containing protein, partial [Acidobacteriaceae bacterium]
MSNLVQLGIPQTGPAATLVYDDWCPAIRTDQLRGKTLRTTLLLDIPLVLGRKSDGSVFAVRDSCPHRGIPLSAGWYDGNLLTCRYHGWEFEPCSGQCVTIPSLTTHDKLEPTRIYATAYPCLEKDGWAWIYIPGPGSSRKLDPASLPPIPELPKFSDRYRTAHLTAD